MEYEFSKGKEYFHNFVSFREGLNDPLYIRGTW